MENIVFVLMGSVVISSMLFAFFITLEYSELSKVWKAENNRLRKEIEDGK